MLSKISLLTVTIFCALYPLCFLISRKDPLKHNFHHFHLGLPVVILGAAMPFVWMHAPTVILKGFAVIWFLLLTVISAYYWKKEYPDCWIMIAPAVLGLFVFTMFQFQFTGRISHYEALVGVLSGIVLTSSIYAMNLGHFYLNVHGLPIEHLIRATYVFWYFTGIRLAVDLYQLALGKISHGGELIPIWKFVSHLDGFLLLVGVFFGTVFPFIALFFVKETLRLKNTQSSTGILYVILSGLLIGDITYKYYLLKFGVAL